MATQNTISTLDGLFKEVYGSSVVNLLPDFAILSRKVTFKASERIGEGWAIPVKLQHEHGFTYGASGDGAFTLLASVAGKIGKAIVNSAQIVLKSQMDYESAFKASSGGKQAFMDASQAMVENMMESFAKRQELAFLYGGKELGLIDSNTVSGTTLTVSVNAASWAPGIWVGMVNCPFDIVYSPNNTLITTTTAVTLNSVNIAAKELVFTGTEADYSEIDPATDGLARLVFRGAVGKECNGIDTILSNSGSLYSLNAAVYELWRSTSYAVSGTLSMEKVQEAASQAVALGLKEDVILLCAPRAWTQLNNDLSALRRFDKSYNPAQYKNGAEGIEYCGVSGKIEIIAHPFVKEGEAFILPVKRCKRVGSTDITFKRPGNPNSFYREIDAAAGFELRAYSDQQFFIEAPGMAVKLTGITY
jgi:hypothetical protein